MTIVKRGTKGSALTYDEMDENIRDLHEDTTINRVLDNGSGSGSADQYITYSNGNIGIGVNTPSAPLDIDGNSIRLRQSQTLVSSNSAGVTGEIAWDSNYIYVCIATNTWKRADLATW